MDKVVNVIEPIQLYVLFTCIAGWAFLDKKQIVNRMLQFILCLMVFTELISSVMIYFSTEIELLYSISMPLHNMLWLLVLYMGTGRQPVVKYTLWIYMLFAAVNFFFLQGNSTFNHYTFIIGAFMYIILFILISFGRLRNEDFSFFRHSTFLLLFSPILFFFGLSFVFGFNSITLARTVVFNNIYLYQVIILIVNIVYYTLLNLYIFKEKRKVWKKET